MYYLEKRERDKISAIFKDWDDTLVLSYLEGYMGEAWVDNQIAPKSAQIISGDFFFFAGIPNEKLIRNIPKRNEPSEEILFIAKDDGWRNLIEKEYEGRYLKASRYAIKKGETKFNREKLNAYVSGLAKEYEIRQIDEKLYDLVKKESWSRDLTSQFANYEEYERYGLGFVATYRGEIVSGASSYVAYRDGIEIEIDTKNEYRRKGLATICGARLILECLDKKIYPSWDAANLESVALAEKLGYSLEKEYPIHIISI